jgi:hypothetical protein
MVNSLVRGVVRKFARHFANNPAQIDESHAGELNVITIHS